VDPIQLFVPHFRIDETLEQIRECLEKGWTGMGYKTVEFEKEWMSYTGHSNALFLNSATAALHLAIESFQISESWSADSEVISTGLTFISTNHAILYCGLKPVFADIDKYGCMDPKSLLEKIGPKTKAVIFVGLGGSTGQLKKISEICKNRNLRLIIDAAHMSGTRFVDDKLSNYGDAICYSFQAVKNLPTADSGALSFRDDLISQIARKLSWLGISKDTYARANKGNYSWNYDVEYTGYKYNGNAVMAAMALVALKYLEDDNEVRRTNFDLYKSYVKEHDELSFVPIPDDCISSRHLVQILVKDREGLLNHLNADQIFPGVHYRDNTEYKMYIDSSGSRPVTQAFSNGVISLPNYIGLSPEAIRRVSSSVNSFYGK